VSGSWPAFWHLLTWACVAWYTCLTFYVAWRGIGDIRGMLRRLKAAEPPADGAGGRQGRR
jgi:hypothetical protein